MGLHIPVDELNWFASIHIFPDDNSVVGFKSTDAFAYNRCERMTCESTDVGLHRSTVRDVRDGTLGTTEQTLELEYQNRELEENKTQWHETMERTA